MTNLSVNINKVATLRNARGGNLPNVLQVALDIEKFGADGITVHPRPDERHIRRSDVYTWFREKDPETSTSGLGWEDRRVGPVLFKQTKLARWVLTAALFSQL